MERKKLMLEFARRLNQKIYQKGYGSQRSKTGIDIKKLSVISGCSYQMARKYTLGQALPEIHVIIKIAEWLGVSPNELLLDEKASGLNKQSKTAINIEPELLKYILNKSTELLSSTCDTKNVINFIFDTIYDASHLEVESKTVYKIIDMMISSATKLNSNQDDQQYVSLKSN